MFGFWGVQEVNEMLLNRNEENNKLANIEKVHTFRKNAHECMYFFALRDNFKPLVPDESPSKGLFRNQKDRNTHFCISYVGIDNFYCFSDNIVMTDIRVEPLKSDPLIGMFLHNFLATPMRRFDIVSG